MTLIEALLCALIATIFVCFATLVKLLDDIQSVLADIQITLKEKK